LNYKISDEVGEEKLNAFLAREHYTDYRAKVYDIYD